MDTTNRELGQQGQARPKPEPETFDLAVLFGSLIKLSCSRAEATILQAAAFVTMNINQVCFTIAKAHCRTRAITSISRQGYFLPGNAFELLLDNEPYQISPL